MLNGYFSIGLELEIVGDCRNNTSNYAISHSGIVVFILKISSKINAEWISSIVGVIGRKHPIAFPFRILFSVISEGQI